jgi:hypothetical protein
VPEDKVKKFPAFAIRTRVVSVRRFLPAGPVAFGEPPATDGIRTEHFVQLSTDPGGSRTLAVGSIFLKRKEIPEAADRASQE